jgi:hypothetical protein
MARALPRTMQRDRLRVFPRLAQRIAQAAPLVFAVTVLSGIAFTIGRLFGPGHPVVPGGWSDTTQAAAAAVALGHQIYQSPAVGFTDGIFPPFIPLVGGALNAVYLWSGWVILLNIAAGVAMIALAARLAYAPPSRAWYDRLIALGGALGIGAFAWWLQSTLVVNRLLDARVDQPSWALALLGLACLPAALRGSRWAMVGAIVLMTAGIWTKQTAAVVFVAGVGWGGLACLVGWARWRAWLVFTAVTVVLNAALVGIAELVTDNWFGFYTYTISRREAIVFTWRMAVDNFWRTLVIATGVTVVVWVIVAVGLSRGRGRRRLRLRQRLSAVDDEGRLATLLVVLVVIGSIGAVYATRKQGTNDNHSSGVVWALALLVAIGWRYAVARAETATAAAVVIVAVFVLAQVDGVKSWVSSWRGLVPPVHPYGTFYDVPADLKAYARHHLVYSQTTPDLVPWAGSGLPGRVRDEMYPNYSDLADVLAAGEQPRYLIRALLGRRFDAVQLLPDDAGYASAYGAREEGYIWKLNEIMKARYRPGGPQDYLVRRPGPDPAPWQRHCFAPFHLAGVTFEIGHGGGFWCLAPGSSTLRMRGTPGPFSEVRTTRPVRTVAGAIGIGLADGSGDMVLNRRDGTAWSLHAERQGARVVMKVREGSRRLGEAAVPVHRGERRARLVVAFVPGAPALTRHGATVRVPTPDPRGARVVLAALGGSDAGFDLARLRLRAQ